MEFLLDEQGHPLLDIDYKYHVLADFLSGDIQRSLFSVNEYMHACNDVDTGKIPKWEGTGNAHTVTIKKDGVNIFNEYSEEELDINSIEEFKSYLEQWKQLLITNSATE